MATAWLDNVALTAGVQVNHAAFVADGNIIHFIYRDSTNIKYRKSTNEGSTWTAATTIGTGADDIPLDKAITCNGNYVHVHYAKNEDNVNSPPTLWYIRSSDGGTTWDSPVQMWDGTDDGNNRFIRGTIAITKNTNYTHMLWVSHSNVDFSTNGIYFRKSTDNGTTWSSKVKLFSATASSPGRPDLCIENGIMHLTWTDTRNGTVSGNGGETYYSRSIDSGSTWSTEVNLSNTTTHDTLRPGIAAIDNVVVSVWQYPIGTEDIYVVRSTDSGVSWGSPVVLYANTGNQEHASVASHNNIFAVVFGNRNDSPDAVYTSISKDYGVTWSTSQKPYTPSADSAAPLLDFSNRFLLIIDKIASTAGVALLRSPVFLPDPVTTTLLDDANRADDASPPPGSNWNAGPLNTTSTEGLAVLTNQFTRKSSGSYRQGDVWVGTPATIGPDVDIVIEVSAWTNTNANGFALYGRLVDLGSTTHDGYAMDVTRGSSINNMNLWSITNATPTTIKTTSGITITAGDMFCLMLRSNLIVGWQKSSTGVWTQIAAAIDSANTATGTVGLEMLNNQNTKVTNIWATAITNSIISPAASITIR